MRLTLAVRGDLRAALDADLQAGKRATTEAMREVGNGLHRALVAQAEAAGLGGKLSQPGGKGQGGKVAGLWRVKVYPEKEESLNAATIVRSVANYKSGLNLHDVFDRGVVVHARRGYYLAIPTEEAKGKFLNKRITPSNWPDHRYGPLRFVWRGSNRPSLLVADGLRARTGKSGGFARASARALSKGNTASVVMFVLVPQVRIKKRLDLQPLVDEWGDRVAQLILRRWPDANS